jgi:hypothetical protein
MRSDIINEQNPAVQALFAARELLTVAGSYVADLPEVREVIHHFVLQVDDCARDIENQARAAEEEH